ncbi:MAG: hypothetical protein K2Q01_12255 [Rickettsiales bacterium]|nr:hypothetical protein [Rickettsiales bacterium]
MRKARCFYRVVMALGLAVLAPFVLGQALLLTDSTRFDPDMFTLSGFLRYYDAELFTEDYTARYYLSQWTPPGYLALTYVWAQAFDPRVMHRLLPVVLWLSCLWPVYMAGRQLGGRANALATLGLYAGSCIFVFRIVGGMAHGFGFPLVWWAVAALVMRKPVWLAGVCVAAALFYPLVAPMLGMVLGIMVLFSGGKGPWPMGIVWWKRGAWLCVPGVVTLLLIAPMAATHSDTYGPGIDVIAGREEFPEAYSPLVYIPPFPYLISAYVLNNSSRLGLESGQFLTLGIFGLLFISVLLRDVRDKRPARLSPFVYAAGACFLGSFLFAPVHAYRFAIYTFPVLVTLFIPLALRDYSRVLLPRRMQAVGFAALVLSLMALTARADKEASGYLYSLEPFQVRALDFIGGLPKDAVLAGWPGDHNGRIAEAVPYVAARSVLITYTGHAVAHREYALEMRRRMNALVDAYLAKDVKPLMALRDDFGVDYLIVNEADLHGDGPPVYMEPFNTRAKGLWEKNRGSFIALTLDARVGVYQQDGIHILDLRHLPFR